MQLLLNLLIRSAAEEILIQVHQYYNMFKIDSARTIQSIIRPIKKYWKDIIVAGTTGTILIASRFFMPLWIESEHI